MKTNIYVYQIAIDGKMIAYPNICLKELRFDSAQADKYGTNYQLWQKWLRKVVAPFLMQKYLIREEDFDRLRFQIKAGSFQRGKTYFPVVDGKFDKGYVKNYGVI